MTESQKKPRKARKVKTQPDGPLTEPDPEDEKKLSKKSQSYIMGWNKVKRGIRGGA